jgi:hypothetical protein
MIMLGTYVCMYIRTVSYLCAGEESCMSLLSGVLICIMQGGGAVLEVFNRSVSVKIVSRSRLSCQMERKKERKKDEL